MFMGADRLGTNSGMDETGMAFFAAKYVQMSGSPSRAATAPAGADAGLPSSLYGFQNRPPVTSIISML